MIFATTFPRKSTTDFDSKGPDLFIIGKKTYGVL